MDTKALRQKILDLAIRGKLVPQDPNAEPASVLLERIREQKKQMVKEGKLKAKDIKNDTIIFVGEDNLHYEKFQDGTVKCIEDEIPFEVPEAWEWCRLNSIATFELGKTLDTAKNTGTYKPYLRSVNVRWNSIDLNDINCMKFEPDELARYSIKKGDLLICEGGDVGRSCVWEKNEEMYYQNALHRVRFYMNINPYFYMYIMMYYANSGKLQEICKGVTIKHLTRTTLLTLLFPLPPQNESLNIINKILEFDSLLQNLEENKNDISYLISCAKSKILDLAIRGQLVPQNPDDEPASVLLERIRTEKEELIKQGKIKRDKKESIIFRGDDNSYYRQIGALVESISDWELDDLPDNWALCCLGELCDYGNCNNVEADSIAGDAWILDLEDIEKDTGKVVQKIRKNERDFTSTKHSFYEGQVLYSKLRPYLNKVIIADEDGFCTSEILPLEFANVVLPQYALYYLMSPTFLRYANQCSYGVKMPRLGTADGRKAIFPLPPIEEQHRIANSISRYFIQMDNILSALL